MDLGRVCVTGLMAVGLALTASLEGAVDAKASQRSSSRKWWLSERFQTALSLDEAQVASLEGVFQDHLPRLRALKGVLDEEEEALSSLLKQGTADESTVTVQIDRVESARGELGKLRTLMLYRMRRLLSAEQRAALDDLHRSIQEERHRNRSSGSGSR